MRLLATLLVLGGLALAQEQSGKTQMAMRPGRLDANEQRIAKEVRHELVMLPYYSLFDDLQAFPLWARIRRRRREPLTEALEGGSR